MDDNPLIDSLAGAWEEEGLFARDLQGRLIRVEPATQRDYETLIEIEIDGRTISVPKAAPATDSQGNPILDRDGRTVPRRTTIYDAAYRLFGETLKTEAIIPTLCHADHLHPVGVCRVCSVAVARRETDRRDPTKIRETIGEKLLPACVQPVEPGMVVHTRQSPANPKAREKVESSLRVLLELLAADHLAQSDVRESDFSRLYAAVSGSSARSFAPERFRLGEGPPRSRDDSSQFIAVDHTACILCDRCSRSCNDIKSNFVIGRTGKGYEAHIGFDLNDPMGDSSCVQCGECMLACPTSALTFRRPIESDWYRDELSQRGRSAVTCDDLANVPLLSTMSRRWLEWNAASIVRWDVQAGETICSLGEFGSTAFVIASGRYEVLVPKRGETAEAVKSPSNSWFSRLFGGGDTKVASSRELRSAAEMTSEDLIFGEMSCLSGYPRNASIRALEAGTLYVIRRNVLFALQRNPQARARLEERYLQRAVFDQVRRVEFFEGLTPEERARCEATLREEAKLVALEPGRPVFRQGERPDALYIVRIGHVKLTSTYAGSERTLTYLGPNKLFGEIAFVLGLPEFADSESLEDWRGRRTASAYALDDVELVRISSATFRRLLEEFPALRSRFVQAARETLAAAEKRRPDMARADLTRFTDEGYFNAQKLLVIDLEACTRCDECTKACSDTHSGIARFIRDGNRFDQFLVAGSCRSCTDPYCLVGCPVDSIHRDGERLEIRIENHCIGCGLCANNCPYGSINMVPNPSGGNSAEPRFKATTCDLCSSVVRAGEEVSCVYACPHHAAHRMSGPQLLETVESRRRTGDQR